MSTEQGGFTIDRSVVVHLASDATLARIGVSDDYWDHRAERAELSEGRILSVFTYEATWSWWERHPAGDELVYVLSGGVTFHFETASDSGQLDLRKGQCGIVPEGTWHRAEITTPTQLLFVTPTPARTELRSAAR